MIIILEYILIFIIQFVLIINYFINSLISFANFIIQIKKENNENKKLSSDLKEERKKNKELLLELQQQKNKITDLKDILLKKIIKENN
jgi:biopolymer transport protein ExbB/TolQ